jgi:hypothetical protein
LSEKLELAASHCLNGGTLGPLRRNRLAFELEQVVDCNRDRLHCPPGMPNRQCFCETKPAD